MTHTPNLDQARAALAAGDAQAAFTALRSALFDPDLVLDRSAFVETMTVFVAISRVLAGDAFAATVQAVVDAPDDPQALYNLGYELIEQGLAGAAATVLQRANYLAPQTEAIVTELSAALERDLRYEAARDVLLAAPELLTRSFICRYLLAFSSLMSGDLATARSVGRVLHPRSDDDGTMAQRIVQMLDRCDALEGVLPLDERDLRGWHLALTGGVLLHRSPYGLDEGMNGRYAFLQDSYERCVAGTRLVAAALAACGITLRRVFGLPDRDSLILARAAAHLLNLPFEEWPAQGSTAPGLIVAYDLGASEDEVLLSLHDKRPQQVLWAHASCWTRDQWFAADFTTYLYQKQQSPWGARLQAGPEQGTTVTVPADAARAEEIAARVASAVPERDDMADDEELAAFLQAVLEQASATMMALRQDGEREHQWAGSPVPSSRFS
ncbi:MAG: hypothetical protein H7Z42_12365 [Roseiflexaceae bacterium]|nr:hypothetical protein [Roseiflexaceae bacterium]